MPGRNLATGPRLGSGRQTATKRFPAGFRSTQAGLGPIVAFASPSAGALATASPRAEASFPAPIREILTLRTIVLIALVLFATAYLACRLEWAGGTSGRMASRSAHWVHTVDGWEDANRWQNPHGFWRPGLHPLIVAALELAISILGLVAFAQRSRSPDDGRSSGKGPSSGDMQPAAPRSARQRR